MRYLKIDKSSGIWQFRFKLPLHTRIFFGVTELTRSLHTSQKKVAIIQALKIEAEIKQRIMDIVNSPKNAVMRFLLFALKGHVDQFLAPASDSARGTREVISESISELSIEENIAEPSLFFAVVENKDMYLDGIFPKGKTPHYEAHRIFEYLADNSKLIEYLTQEDALELMQDLLLFYTKRKQLRKLISNGKYKKASTLWAEISGVQEGTSSAIIEKPIKISKNIDTIAKESEHTIRIDQSVDNIRQQSIGSTKTSLDKILNSYQLEQQNKDVLDRTINATLNSCNTVHQLIEKYDLKLVDRDDVNKAFVNVKLLPKDPKHKRHNGIFEDKTPLERIKINAKEKADVIAPTTANRYIEHCSSVYKWAQENNLITYNPFKSIANRRNRNKKEVDKTDPFSKSDLQHIFKPRTYKQTWQKWVPLIALYSGMRPNEICQLLTSDIKKIEGIWCFDVQDSHDKQHLKNASSARRVPIHSTLLELGILGLITDKNRSMLFPDLTYTEKSHYYGKVETYWSRYIRLDKWTNENKSFYSFRHGLTDFYKQKGVAAQFTGAILGHQNGNITYDTYGGNISITRLKEIMDEFTPLIDVEALGQ
jgi:integrase